MNSTRWFRIGLQWKIYPILGSLLLLTGFFQESVIQPFFPAITTTPKRVVLLLPVNTECKAISEAIQAGFTLANQATHQPLIIHTINMQSKLKNLDKYYTKAVQLGADLIIGPLLKSDVQKLARLKAMTIPILTLNYLNRDEKAPANFYQFGLSPLDEANKIAEHAYAQGLRSALILSPNNPWGNQIKQRLIERWKNLEGNIVDELNYSRSLPILQKQIPRFLQFQSSQERRTDFDVIFLVALPESGHQIKPLLNFYFLKHIPIYATSSIYDASAPQDLNRDLDGTIVCDAPWSLGIYDNYTSIQIKCRNQNPQHFNQYSRYYALGVDAFHLVLNLAQMDATPNLVLNGGTGQLSLDQDRYIVRLPECAILQKGIPEPLVLKT